MNFARMAAVLAALVLGASSSPAQVSRTLTFDFSNPAVMSLDISRNAVSFTLPPNFIPAPREMPEAVSIVVRSNVPWVLTAAVSSDFQSLEDASRAIPSERMEYRCRIRAAAAGVSCQERFQPLVKNEALDVARGGATPDPGVAIVTDYRLRITLQDPAGSYTMPVTYTLSPVQ
ncbi:MAG: hypothetical protein MUF78_08055 [Candidatus Edwardsbacteria bacterium]|jgi:hypothetical protein|nr:hypothetical protein [Candidatus Edwardsbacteria bacterium]